MFRGGVGAAVATIIMIGLVVGDGLGSLVVGDGLGSLEGPELGRRVGRALVGTKEGRVVGRG